MNKLRILLEKLFVHRRYALNTLILVLTILSYFLASRAVLWAAFGVSAGTLLMRGMYKEPLLHKPGLTLRDFLRWPFIKNMLGLND